MLDEELSKALVNKKQSLSFGYPKKNHHKKTLGQEEAIHKTNARIFSQILPGSNREVP